MYQVSYIRQFILASVLVVLGFGIYWWEFKKKPAQETQVEESKKVFLFLRDAQVKSIRLSNPILGTHFMFECADFEAKQCNIEKDQPHWKLTAPQSLASDNINVNALLRSCETLSQTDVIDVTTEQADVADQLLQEYKLNPASYPTTSSIEIVTDTKTVVLHLGEANPLVKSSSGESTTVVLEDNPKKILLVPNLFVSNFGKDLFHWREKKLLALERKNISQLRLEWKEKNKSITMRLQENKWFLDGSGSDSKAIAADPEKIDEFLQSIVGLKAVSFLFENKEETAAKKFLAHTKQLGSIQLSLQDDQAITLKLFDKHPEAPADALTMTVSSSSGVYAVEASLGKQLSKEIKDFRIAKLMSGDNRFSVQSIEFSGKGFETPVLLKQTEESKLSFESNGKLLLDDEKKAQSVFDLFFTNQITQYVRSENIPEANALKVAISLKGEENKRVFYFWKKNEQILVKDAQSSRNEWYVMDASFQSSFPWNMQFFEEPKKPAEN